ncbi:MAG: hypothetical protein Kow00109_00870 [Acidobacteriota bacterium]
MAMSLLRTLVAVVLLSQSAAILNAQRAGRFTPSPWELSWFTGVNFGQEKTASTPVAGGETRRDVLRDAASGYLVGIRITENRGRRFSAELDYTMANQPFGFVNLSSGIGRLDLEHRVHTAVYSVLYNLFPPQAALRPYVAVGLGASFYQVDGDAKDAAEAEGVSLTDRWKLAGSWGGGLKWRLGESWGVRFDARDVITGTPDYGLPHTADFFQGLVGPGFRPEGLLHNWQVSTGFSYYFDGF